MLKYVPLLKKLGTNILCFIDCDKPQLVEELRQYANIVCCDTGFSIEQQLFNDAPEKVFSILIENAKARGKLPKSYAIESTTRQYLGQKSKEEDWYKNIGLGRYLGELVFLHINEFSKDSKFILELQEIIDWLSR